MSSCVATDAPTTIAPISQSMNVFQSHEIFHRNTEGHRGHNISPTTATPGAIEDIIYLLPRETCCWVPPWHPPPFSSYHPSSPPILWGHILIYKLQNSSMIVRKIPFKYKYMSITFKINLSSLLSPLDSKLGLKFHPSGETLATCGNRVDSCYDISAWRIGGGVLT